MSTSAAALVGGGIWPGVARRQPEIRYGGSWRVIEVTASYSAACKIARLRVRCTVARLRSGIARMAISSWFQSTTSCPAPILGPEATVELAGRCSGGRAMMTPAP